MAAPLTPSHRPTVLLVEDDADTREMYALHLANAGFSTIEASDGLVALERARNFQPDLIALDLAMPRLDGFELCRRLKADALTRNIPVVMVTGLTESIVERRAREVGCVKVLYKPCEPTTLLAVVRRILVGCESQLSGSQQEQRMPGTGRTSAAGGRRRKRG